MLKKVIKIYKWWIIVYVLFGITSSILTSFGIVFLQRIIDAVNTRLDLASIVASIVIYGILLGAKALVEYLINYPHALLNNGIVEKIRVLALKKLSRIDYLEYQKMGTGEVIKIIENGASAGRNIVFSFYLRVVSELLPSLVVSLIFISFFDIKVMLVIMVGYIAIFIFSRLLLTTLYKYKETLLDKQEKNSKYTIRSFMELVVFRMNKRYKAEIEKISDTADEIVKTQCTILMIHEAFFFLFEILVILVKVVVLFIGVKNILSGNTTIGILVAMISFIDRIYSPIAIFNVLYIQYKLDSAAYSRFDQFYNKAEDKNLDKGIELEKVDGAIELRNLFFSYNDAKLLENLAFSIASGSSVAIVGESGGGKSTIVKLICGLLKKQDGELLIDGIDLDSIALNSYYGHMSYLSQEPAVFDATIRENIVFDDPVSDDVIYEYLEMVSLKDKVCSLDKQLDGLVGERGIQLSGGERQRLALARVLAQNKNLIILDEAVSALDSITEQLVMGNVIDRLAGKTLIIIAHRLQIIKNVDKIIVFKNNKILSQGTFVQLIESCDYFKELWNDDLNTSISQCT